MNGLVKKKYRRWLWVLLFVLSIIILLALGTLWNVVWVSREDFSWVAMVFGTIGFLTVLGLATSFFVRLLSEMTLNQLQTEFLARVSHELKTPVATLRLTSELLQRDDLSTAERSRLWSNHQIELTRLNRDIESLLLAARWEFLKPSARLEPIDLRTWLLESQGLWKSLLGNQSELKTVFPESPVIAFLDPRLLKLVAENFVQNSLKFSAASPNLKVTLHSNIQDKKWDLLFEDSGIGFPAEDSEKIFGKFFRGSHISSSDSHVTSKGKKIPGTGLGLYLVNQACRSMKIEVRARSKGPMQGAQFILSGDIIK